MPSIVSWRPLASWQLAGLPPAGSNCRSKTQPLATSAENTNNYHNFDQRANWSKYYGVIDPTRWQLVFQNSSRTFIRPTQAQSNHYVTFSVRSSHLPTIWLANPTSASNPGFEIWDSSLASRSKGKRWNFFGTIPIPFWDCNHYWPGQQIIQNWLTRHNARFMSPKISG